MALIATMALALQMTSALSASGSAPDDSLRTRIERRIAEVSGAAVVVAFRDLTREDTLFLNADEPFHAVTTMKVPVMVDLFRRMRRGQLSFCRRLELKNVL